MTWISRKEIPMTKSRSIVMGVMVVLLVLTTGFAPGRTTAVAADLVVYDDSLGAGWQNWSWSTTVDFAATAPVYGGARSLAVT